MNKSNVLVAIIAISGFSVSSQAATVSTDRGGYYVGLDYWGKLDGREQGQTGHNWDFKYKSDHSIGIKFGLVTRMTDLFYLGYEMSYNNLGTFEGESVDQTSRLGNSIEIKGDALLLSVKPKYYLPETDLYFAALGGVGRYKITFEDKTMGYKRSDSGIGFQLGIEAGYDFTDNFNLNIGYRKSYTELNTYKSNYYDFEIGTYYLGATYRF